MCCVYVAETFAYVSNYTCDLILSWQHCILSCSRYYNQNCKYNQSVRLVIDTWCCFWYYVFPVSYLSVLFLCVFSLVFCVFSFEGYFSLLCFVFLCWIFLWCFVIVLFFLCIRPRYGKCLCTALVVGANVSVVYIIAKQTKKATLPFANIHVLIFSYIHISTTTVRESTPRSLSKSPCRLKYVTSRLCQLHALNWRKYASWTQKSQTCFIKWKMNSIIWQLWPTIT